MKYRIRKGFGNTCVLQKWEEVFWDIYTSERKFAWRDVPWDQAPAINITVSNAE